MQDPQAQTHNLFHLSTCMETKDRVFKGVREAPWLSLSVAAPLFPTPLLVYS